MRTKALLIAAAALAAGVISSQAQVYSQNIVGYVNVPAVVGNVNISSVFDDANGNSLTNIIANTGGMWDFTTVNIWNGTGYTGYTLDSSFPTGVADPSDSFGVPAPTINPGTAFFFVNNTSGSNTVTEVGTVHVSAPPTGTQTVGTSTNTIGTNPSIGFLASVIPVGGGLGSVLNFNAAGGVPDFTTVNVPKIVNGVIAGFTGYTVDSSFPSGFADASDSVGVPEPIIPVGSGFFFVNNSGATVNWTQSF
jgi:hypothetical protein